MIRRIEHGTTAGEIMIPVNKLIVLRPEMDALTAVRMLIRQKISGAPVVDAHNRYLGVFSEKTSMQFLHRLAYDGLPSSDVGSFMNTELERTIDEDTLLLSVLEMFLRTPYRRLPVLSNGLLVGQISRRDVLAATTKSLDQPASGKRPREPLYLSALLSRVDQRIRL